tara:strand:- start:28400 stop:28639 length:240 start_codon:yes stop_codon:yes gene_type:complete
MTLKILENYIEQNKQFLKEQNIDVEGVIDQVIEDLMGPGANPQVVQSVRDAVFNKITPELLEPVIRGEISSILNSGQES